MSSGGETQTAIVCPSCLGRGTYLASGIRYCEGFSGPYSESRPCDRCGCSGIISAEMQSWIDRGKAYQKRRREKRQLLSDACDIMGVSLSELSSLERGMVDNSVLDKYM